MLRAVCPFCKDVVYTFSCNVNKHWRCRKFYLFCSGTSIYLLVLQRTFWWTNYSYLPFLESRVSGFHWQSTCSHLRQASLISFKLQTDIRTTGKTFWVVWANIRRSFTLHGATDGTAQTTTRIPMYKEPYFYLLRTRAILLGSNKCCCTSNAEGPTQSNHTVRWWTEN